MRFNGRRIERACYVVEGNDDLLINIGLQSKWRPWSFIPSLTWLCPSAALIVDPDSSSIFGFLRPGNEKFSLLHCFSRRICHLESKKRKERIKCLNRAILSFRELIPQRWVKRRKVAKRWCIHFSEKSVNILTWGVFLRGSCALYSLLFRHRAVYNCVSGFCGNSRFLPAELYKIMISLWVITTLPYWKRN